jgi:hypothetical protein
MNNFDKVYNSILREGKADPANKKGTKESAPFQKHRNKMESRASSKASRRRGKKETMAEGYGYGDAEDSVDYRELFGELKGDIEIYIGEIYDGDESGEGGMYDKYGDEGRSAIEEIVGGLEVILASY